MFFYNCDPKGDTTLHVGTGPSRFSCNICSHTLSRCSPVWEWKLKLSRSDDPEESPWAETDPEDDANAMKILLNIVHSKFARVPNYIALNDLYELAVLVEKYKMAEVLRPWAQKWSHDLISNTAKDKSSNEKALFVSWVLGTRFGFEHFAKDLATVAESTYPKWGECKQPRGATGYIIDIRRNMIATYVDILKKLVEDLAKPEKYPHCNCEVDTCTDQLLGALIRSFSASGLWPLPNNSALNKSPAQVYGAINNIKTTSSLCATRFISSAEWTLFCAREKIQVKLTPTMTKHLPIIAQESSTLKGNLNTNPCANTNASPRAYLNSGLLIIIDLLATSLPSD
ncbi:hypothetical protein F5Y16DRAFT_424500 [Xylariaceae sp. FL0255]|nr:hypothetical protein F5Y16DRAFT_424500 [Xylariaceae sp. FL0255]